ncbi:MAG TPA: PAS domain S-box protein [Magnetospirillum sp.]|nr:PAS domain S-box protein [Magnetospirillum sp.]
MALSPQQLWGCVHPDDRAWLRDDLPHILRQQGEAEFTRRILKEDGSIGWFRAWERVIEQSGDHMVSECLTIDVSAEFQAKQALEAREADLRRVNLRLETLIGNLPGNVFRIEYDAAGRRVKMSMEGGQGHRVPGKGDGATQLTLEQIIAAIAPEDRELVEVVIPRKLREHGGCVETFRFVPEAGRPRWLRVWESVVAVVGGRMITEGIVIDVTQEMVTSRMLETLISNMPGIVFRYRYPPSGAKQMLFSAGIAVRKYREELGIDISAMSADDFANIFLPEESHWLFVEIPRQLRQDGQVEFTHRFRYPDGSIRWARVWEKVVAFDGDDMITEGISIDVTDEVEAKLALEASEAELRRTSTTLEALIGNLPGNVFRMHYRADGQKRLLFADGGMLRAVPGLRERVATLTCEEFAATFLPEEHELLFVEVPRRLRETGVSVHTFQHMATEGQRSWLRAWEKVISRDGDEMVTEGIVIDVTEEFQAKHALEASEQLYRELVTLTSVGVANIDADGRCTYVNDRFQDMIGWRRGEILGQFWFRGAHPEDIEQTARDWERAVQACAPYRGEFRLLHRSDGRALWVLAQAVPHWDAFGRIAGWVATLTDITDRQSREEMERQLHQAQKMEALGQLAGSVAHDFNNLLGAVLGFARFIVEDSEPGTPSRHHAERIVNAGERGKALVGQILSFARRDELMRADFCAADLVQEIQTLLAVSIPATVRMSVSVADTVSVVTGDRHRLGQVLINLCINARDALEGRPGQVGISIQPTDGANPALARLAARGPASAPDVAEVWSGDGDRCHAVLGTFDPAVAHVSIAVSDTGCGMTTAVLGHAFKPFFTTKEQGYGTGLGLSMVSSAVLAHGGAIMVDSRLGQGTTFTVVLPVIAQQAAEAPKAPVSPGPPIAAGARLLLVDDDLDFGEMMLTALTRRGFEVTHFPDPREALLELRAAPGVWDAVLTDQTMAHMTGTDFIREARIIRDSLPCILCTGYADDHFGADKATEIGAFALLRKTVGVGEIIDAVSRAVGSGGHRST